MKLRDKQCVHNKESVIKGKCFMDIPVSVDGKCS